MATKEKTDLKEWMLKIFLPHVKACWSATFHRQLLPVSTKERNLCFHKVQNCHWDKLECKGHVIKAPGKVTLSIMAIAVRQGLPKPNNKHWSNKLQVNLCTRNCADFQMQNSSDQKENRSLPRRLKLRIAKTSKWSILQEILVPLFLLSSQEGVTKNQSERKWFPVQ